MSSQPNVSQDMHFITDCRIPFLFLLVSSTQDFHPDRLIVYPFPDYHHIHQLVIINFRSAILSTLMSIATSYIILFVSPFPRAVSVKYQHRVCNLVSLHISDHHCNFTVSLFGQSVTIIKATLAHEQRHSKLSTSFLLIMYRILNLNQTILC